MCSCTPYIEYLGEGGRSSSPPSGTLPSQLGSSFLIGFHFAPIPDDDTSSSDDGRCWLDMFRNAVIVGGYPISRRAAVRAGVEMPLNMMARMVRADHVTPFGSTWFVKGFSSMLVLTGCREEVLLWHHIYDPDGGHLSYTDYLHTYRDDRHMAANALVDVTSSQVQNARHVVGWCSEARLYAGEFEA